MKTQYQIARVLLATVLFSASSVFAHDPKGNPDPMVTGLEPLKGEQFEKSYLEQMIQHHRHGIEMGKLARDHTKRAELRQFADKMIAMQEQEIGQMTKWLTEWYKSSPKQVANEKADKEMKMHMSMLSAKKDADFDKAFLEMMPRHHDAAVEMSEQAEKKSTHRELKEFAAKMAKDQRKEIQQMKSWAQSWFGPA